MGIMDDKVEVLAVTVRELIGEIEPASEAVYSAAMARWDGVAKPLGGLGMLESQLARVAAAQHRGEPEIHRRSLVVMCADNGVVDEGVSQAGADVTATMAIAIAEGRSSVCRMAASAGVDVVAVDLGVKARLRHPRLRDERLMDGTANIARGPAMSRAVCERAMLVGAGIAEELGGKGCGLALMGELGMGNTTTSAAVASALLRCDPAALVGRGAGLSDAGLLRKRDVVRGALALNRPDPDDPIDVIGKVGGLDIAALCGLVLGCARRHVPVVVDGVIAGVAALAAVRLCPDSLGYLLGSHVSAEPAGQIILDALGLDAPIRAGLHLGEGTGAVALAPLLDMALAVYCDALTFNDAAIGQYERYGV